jgi:hypothetical protein
MPRTEAAEGPWTTRESGQVYPRYPIDLNGIIDEDAPEAEAAAEQAEDDEQVYLTAQAGRAPGSPEAKAARREWDPPVLLVLAAAIPWVERGRESAGNLVGAPCRCCGDGALAGLCLMCLAVRRDPDAKRKHVAASRIRPPKPGPGPMPPGDWPPTYLHDLLSRWRPVA